MKIEIVRGAFSRFKDSIDLRVSDNDTVIYAEIDKKDLASFASMLIDISNDCLLKLGDEYLNDNQK